MLQKNPILSFRNSQKLNENKERNIKYDLEMGVRVDNQNNLLIINSSNDELLSTLITETREAVDSAENSLG